MTKDEVLDIISDAGYAIMGTAENDQPRVRPIMPFLHNNELLIGLVPGARSVEQIKMNPKVELCFVDRKMQFCRIAGIGKISNDSSKKKILWDNVPVLRQYFNGPEDPIFMLLEISIQSAEAMSPMLRHPEKIDII